MCVCGSDSPTSESIFSSATYFFSVVQQPPVGQNLLIIEASSLHSDTSHSVGLLWTSDQSDAETYTGQYSTFAMDRHPCSRWDSNPKSQRPQTPTLDRAATGTGYLKIWRSEVLHRTITLPVELYSNEIWSLILNEGLVLKVRSMKLWVSQNAIFSLLALHNP